MPKRYWYVIITYIVMQFSSLPVAFLIRGIQPEIAVDIMIYWSIFSFIAGLTIVLLFLKPDMQAPTHRSAVSIGGVIGWSIAGVFLAFIGQALAVMIEIEILGIDPGSENTMAIMDIARANALFILIPAIVAPILEEIIFRKIIFGSLYKKMNFFFAALLSSFIFAFIHMDHTHLLLYVTMGFIFAFLYVQTKRIIVPIIVHAGMNTIVVMTQYSLTPEEIQKMLDEVQMIFFPFF